MFFHNKFKECLGLDSSLFDDTVLIDDEEYFLFYNSEGRDSLNVDMNCNGLMIKAPPIIKLLCQNIKPCLSQESFSKEIGIIHIEKDKCNKVLHHYFRTKEHLALMIQSHHT